MSVINKKPFIEKILEETSDADLAVLNGLLNGASTTLFKSLIDVKANPTGAATQVLSKVQIDGVRWCQYI